MTNLWTKLTVLLLVLHGLSTLWSIFGLGLDPVTMVLAIELALFMAAVAWMETKSGTLLVVLMGLVLLVQNIITTTLYLFPQYGPQSGQYLYTLFVLLIPTFSYLSYRKISQRGGPK